MEFWNSLSSKTKRILIGILSFIVMGSGFFLYPRLLKNHSEDEIILPTELKQITVYVTGAVHKPGVYSLPHGSRVKDLLQIAGGASKDWDPEGINLAKVLDDEDMVVVPKQTNASDPSRTSPKTFGHKSPLIRKKSDPGQTVSLNRGTAAELETVPGVGPGMAKRILDYRKIHGSFHSVDEIRNVPGIGLKKFQKLKPHLRL